MDVVRVTESGAERHTVAELDDLLAKNDLIWVDIPSCDDDAARVLRDVFHFHPLAIRDCVERNRVPRVHPYDDHVLVVMHTPERGRHGHVHYVELDLLIGPRYVITVHGPVNPAVPPEIPLRETQAVLRRIESGRMHPSTPYELTRAIATTIARRQERFIEELTSEVWALEQRVTGGHLGNPEQFLEEMFQARHGLVTVRTIAALDREVYNLLLTLRRAVPTEDRTFVEEIVDRFERVRSIADGEKEYLQGVIEFYRTRTETKMTVAAERLAVIAVVTLPITALSSVLGMNLIVNDRTDFLLLSLVLLVMIAMSTLLLTWAKRQGWW
ncbi:MAG TPA: magnesium transporter CorA family protein [Actinomycetes bacterium]|nr:magnesium transporter CorA family protein [Actinomycetes bacterium]